MYVENLSLGPKSEGEFKYYRIKFLISEFECMLVALVLWIQLYSEQQPLFFRPRFWYSFRSNESKVVLHLWPSSEKPIGFKLEVKNLGKQIFSAV